MSKVDLDDSWWNGVTNGLTNRLTDNAISTVASWFGGGCVCVQNASFKVAAQCLTLGEKVDWCESRLMIKLKRWMVIKVNWWIKLIDE